MTRFEIVTNPVSAQAVAWILRANGYGGIADQIEAQCKPPRIEEPGWGKKVTASIKHSPDRQLWIATKDGPSQWWHSEAGHRVSWSSLIDPGVES